MSWVLRLRLQAGSLSVQPGWDAFHSFAAAKAALLSIELCFLVGRWLLAFLLTKGLSPISL